MDNNIVKLAKMFKDRENNNNDTFILGTVISTSPLKIKNNGFDYDSTELFSLQDTYAINSKVALIPSLDGQTFLVLGEIK